MKFINSVFVLHPDRLFCMLTCTVLQTLQKKQHIKQQVQHQLHCYM